MPKNLVYPGWCTDLHLCILGLGRIPETGDLVLFGGYDSFAGTYYNDIYIYEMAQADWIKCEVLSG